MTLEELQAQLDAEKKAREEAQAQVNALTGDLTKAKDSANALERLKKKAEEAAAEAAAKAAKVEGLGDLDEATIAAFQTFQKNVATEQEKKAYEEGGIDALVALRLDGQVSPLNKKIDALEGANAALNETNGKLASRIQNMITKGAIDAALVGKTTLNEGMADFIHFTMARFIKWDEETETPYLHNPDTGDDFFEAGNPANRMGMSEFIDTQLHKYAPAAFKPTQGGPGGGSKDGGKDHADNPFMDKSRRTEQRQIRNSDPALAKRLAEAARSAGKGDQVAIAGL